MKVPNFNPLIPRTIEEAAEMVKEEEGSVFLAGGTDLVPLMKYGLKRPRSVIFLHRVKGIEDVRQEGEGYFIGAGVRLKKLCEDPVLSREFPSLSRAAGRTASPQIRGLATLGGNLLQDRRCIYFNQTRDWRVNLAPCFKLGGLVCHQMNASPVCRALYYSDLAPMLLALDARAIVFDGEEREIPLRELVSEHTARNGGTAPVPHILKGIFLKRCEGAWTRFEKYAVRGSLNFPLLNLSVWARLEEGRSVRARIFAGAVNTSPVELTALEALLLEGDVLREGSGEAAELALKELEEKSLVVREAGASIGAKKRLLGKASAIVCGMLDAFSGRMGLGH